MMRRRTLLVCGACSLLGATSSAGPGERADIRQQRLQNRLELWESYAKRTENLMARYVCTRNSSLLLEPLVTTGTLAFVAPATLVLRDDGPTGSTTRIDGDAISIRPNQTTLPPGPDVDATTLPAAAWLRARLLSLFAPGPGSELLAGIRHYVPKGRGYRLELLPQRGSVERKVLRAVAIRLDPVGGAVLEIEIQEAQGDRVRLRLSDHRQNVAEHELAQVLAPDTPG